MNVCPECDGEQMVNHPAGLLTFQHHIDCGLLQAEDATAAADHQRLHHGPITRTTTDTERLLLGWLGYKVEDGMLTRVERITTSVLHREWTDLERTDDAPPAA